jgi:hypothetical protein
MIAIDAASLKAGEGVTDRSPDGAFKIAAM